MQYFGVVFLMMLFMEVMSIVWVADWLGGGLTLFLMIGSFILGTFMLRRIGTSGILLAAATVRGNGKISLYQLLWPIRYAVASVLLMSPGFVSTLSAIVLMLPFKGKPVANFNTTGYTDHNRNNFTYTQTRNSADDVIEGEYTVTNNDTSAEVTKYLTDKLK